MHLLTLIFIAIGLAMDAFAVSVSNGISTTEFGKSLAVRQGAYFGFFQCCMPFLGWLLGGSISQYIQAFDHWIAFLLLGAIGGNMIWESTKQGEVCTIKTITNTEFVLQAIATSIDAFAVGVSFALLNVNIYFACSMIGIVAFFFSYAGGFIGRKLGGVFGKKAEFTGGVILLFIGIHILVEHIFFQ